MNKQHATHRLPFSAYQVYDVLTNPSMLPDWNPAIHTLAGGGEAEPGKRYPITARGGLTGYLDYPAVSISKIETHLKVQGLEEHGYWRLTPQGPSTLVEHGFHHLGPLARLLSAAYRGVAELRLNRLGERVRTST